MLYTQPRRPASLVCILLKSLCILTKLTGLTRSLAAEVGQSGIRVNALLPGYIETQMTDSKYISIKAHSKSSHVIFEHLISLDMTPEGRKEALENIPMKRFGRVTEVADAAAFLATNAYANNCVLNLDGGLSAV
jgi:NAD(P)-dependent dehydrogenase (short-subunit alcohol dehydrogenase family)